MTPLLPTGELLAGLTERMVPRLTDTLPFLAADVLVLAILAAAGPVYRLTLRPEPGLVPDGVRLRRLLKRLLRAYGLRCLAVEEVQPAAPGLPQDGPEGKEAPPRPPGGRGPAGDDGATGRG